MSEYKDTQKFLSMQMKMQKIVVAPKKDTQKKGSVETHVSADPPKLLFDYERGKHCYKLFSSSGLPTMSSEVSDLGVPLCRGSNG